MKPIPLTITMHNPAAQILQELQTPGITQASVGITYAFIMAQAPDADWKTINEAIRARWRGKRALRAVQEIAWKQYNKWAGSAA